MNRAEPSITPERVLQLKRDATALRQRTGLKHSAALAQIAQAEGFSSWQRLVYCAGGADAVHEVAVPPEEQARRELQRAWHRRGLK